MFPMFYLAFQVALEPTNMLLCFLGCLMGTFVGVLPGLGPAASISLLLPITFKLPPESAIIMLGGPLLRDHVRRVHNLDSAQCPWGSRFRRDVP